MLTEPRLILSRMSSSRTSTGVVGRGASGMLLLKPRGLLRAIARIVGSNLLRDGAKGCPDAGVARIPPAWAAFPGTGRMNETSVFVDGTVRGSVHKFDYGHKQGAAATPLVA